MPAPTIPPIPIETAAAIPICPEAAADEAPEIFCVVMIEPAPLSVSARRCRLDFCQTRGRALARDNQQPAILRAISAHFHDVMWTVLPIGLARDFFWTITANHQSV